MILNPNFSRPCALVSAGSERLESSIGQGRETLSKTADAVHVRFQETANWYTPSGVAKKRRHIESLGLPDMKGRRFITLSLDPAMFGHCPFTAYVAGVERMRRFLEEGRLSGLWPRGCWWAWKLEFTRKGWAHWHLILDRTRKFSNQEMLRIQKIWGLGRTNCRRISKSSFGYAFKYVFKGVFQEQDMEGGLCLPHWFLTFYRPAQTTVDSNGETSCTKPKSFARVRFWQTSKNFYTGPKKIIEPPAEPKSSCLPRPLREAILERESSVLVIARKGDGQYLSSRKVRLESGRNHFIRLHLWGVDNAQGCTLSSSSFVVDPHTIKQTINRNDLWKLTPQLSTNRLTLRRAMQLRRSRVTLHHC